MTVFVVKENEGYNGWFFFSDTIFRNCISDSKYGIQFSSELYICT